MDRSQSAAVATLQESGEVYRPRGAPPSFTCIARRTVIAGGCSPASIGEMDTQSIVFWDEPHQRYLLYTRNTGMPTHPSGGVWSGAWNPSICLIGITRSL